MSIAVIVPTRQSSRTLKACLTSLCNQTVPCKTVVVDNHSTDGTLEVAMQYADLVISAGPERSQQRNLGARSVDASVLVFVDSDMILEPDVLSEVGQAIRAGAGGVIIPERTVGDGFFARVRQHERSFYGPDSSIEAARGFSARIFEDVGGFDEQLTGPEDWDLTIRVSAKAPIFRTLAGILHDEGHVDFLGACRRKAYYAEGLRRFARKHGSKGVLIALNRAWIRRPWALFYPHPLLGLGVVALKLGETTAIGVALLRRRNSRAENSA
jgi:glycosyltransferase involved in cell wall biosynthesis